MTQSEESELSALHTGSCQCGQVRFEVAGEFESFYLCHCRYCQKDTGSAHAANLFSTTARLSWLAGDAQVREFRVPSTRHLKSFCSLCGSALPSLQLEGTLLVVPAGSLDTPVDIKPTAQLFTSRRAAWLDRLDDVQAFETLPPANSA